MKGSLLTLLFCHFLFLQSFASQHGRRRNSKHHLLARGSPLDQRSANPADDPLGIRDSTILDTIRERRVSNIIGGLSDTEADIPAWLSSLGSDGKWPESQVNYTTGCAARRANWPAQDHWLRILLMSAAWHGGLPGADQYIKNQDLRTAISRAMDYWFSRDFTNLACLNDGGTPSCPCDNPGNRLWNTNWFSNIILIPDLVGQSSLLLDDTLSPSQRDHSIYMLSRSYSSTGRVLTGANALDVSRIGMDQALLSRNTTLLDKAYRRSHAEIVIQNGVGADGIRADGAFGQHDGMTYNGNYGKDYSNDILGNELEAAGTEFAADANSQAAFGTLFSGNSWMIYSNSLTKALHWDFSVAGRFISFPVADMQATASIKTNLTAVEELGKDWRSQPLISFAASLSTETHNANAGSLYGNRMFYTNDYMVHRGQNYVTTLKMWSSRTRNSECTNSQNPFGFHLSDGACYTYIRGDEYEDIFAAWDWSLIPGITVDYGNTPLACDKSHMLGVESFVGGVSSQDGRIGLSAMRYTNPLTRALSWQKAWFFLEDDVQHVMISGLSSKSGASVRSVLDQRRARGEVLLDGRPISSVSMTRSTMLWHGDVGYKFKVDSKVSLTVQVEQKTGDWTKIGTSTQPPVTVDMFTAYLEHDKDAGAVEYSVFPGVDYGTFATKSSGCRLTTVQNDGHIAAVFDEAHETFMAVFWGAKGGAVTFYPPGSGSVVVSVDANVAVTYNLNTGQVTVSDPSQGSEAVRVTITREGGTRVLAFQLPRGGLAGSGVTQTVGR